MSVENCSLRHDNGNCLPVGGFCTAVCDEVCKAVRNAYSDGYENGFTDGQKNMLEAQEKDGEQE